MSDVQELSVVGNPEDIHRRNRGCEIRPSSGGDVESEEGSGEIHDDKAVPD